MFTRVEQQWPQTREKCQYVAWLCFHVVLLLLTYPCTVFMYIFANLCLHVPLEVTNKHFNLVLWPPSEHFPASLAHYTTVLILNVWVCLIFVEKDFQDLHRLVLGIAMVQLVFCLELLVLGLRQTCKKACAIWYQMCKRGTWVCVCHCFQNGIFHA